MPFRTISFFQFKTFSSACIIGMLFTIKGFGQVDAVGSSKNEIWPSIPYFSATNTGDYIMNSGSPGSDIVMQNVSGRSITTTACNTSTFFMHLSAAGQKINIKELQTFTDGNFMLAGNITLVNTEQEGFICIMANSGTIISQKQIRINSKPVSLFSAKVMFTNKIIVAGILHDATDMVFVSLLNTDLSVNWLKVFDMPSQPTKVVLDYTGNGQVGFAVQTSNSSLIYSMLDPGGIQLWSKQSFPQGLDVLVGIGHTDYNEISLLVNCTRSGIKVVEHSRINQNTGASISVHTIGTSSHENKYARVNSFTNKLIFWGIREDNLSQFKLVRDIAYYSATIETEHTYTIPGNIDFTTTCAMDNAGDALFYCLPQDGKLVFIRHFAGSQTSPEYTRQYTVPFGASVISATRSLIDGGYLAGLNAIDSSEFMLVKTDSIGTLPGCGSQNLSNTYSETLNVQNTASPTTSTTVSIAAAAGTLSANVSSLMITTDCNQVFCPPSPGEDTCMSTYLKTYRTNSHTNGIGPYYLMRNNYQIAFSIRNNRIWNDNYNSTYEIKRFDERGNFINGVKMLFNNNDNTYFSERQIDDQHIMLINLSTIDNLQAFTFTLIDDNLQILWTKTVKTFSGFNFNSSALFGDLTSDVEGNYYLVSNNLGFNETRKVLAYKMDANGDPVWLKIYDVPPGLFLTCSATTTNSSLVIVAQGTPRSASLRLDKATGQLLNAYTFITNADGSVYHRFLKFKYDRIYYGGNNQSSFSMGLLDTTGRPFKLKTINRLSSVIRAGAEKDGNFYGYYEYYDGSTYKDVLFKTDSSLNIQFSHDFDKFRNGLPAGLDISNEGNIYMGGNSYYANYYDPFIKKFDANGNLGTCNSVNTTPPVTDDVLDIQIPVCNAFVNTFVITSPQTVTFVPDTLGLRISELLCGSLPQCNSLTISGPDTICQLNLPYTYIAHRNPGCYATPSWIYDTAFAVLQNQTDSSAVFTFKMPGNTWIKAKINSGCSSYIDSMLVQIQYVPQFFSLGNDTLICPGNSLILHAGGGFSSYLWQDASTDSIFIATLPGQYHVRVTNLCGNVYNDTILIAAAIIPYLNIGNDTTVCYADTLNLTASPGFNIYAWQPVSQIIGQGQQVVVVPLQNEIITIKATTPDGCNAYDTLNITSISARPVFIGNDTSFCEPNAITLSAGSGYLQYVWSTGASSMAISINQSGVYWVKVTDINTCKTADTAAIQVFSLPKPNLGADFDLCKGDQKILDAGTYNTYLWNDNSTNRYLTVSLTGNYWVTVTDNNSCIAGDTIIVKNILTIPLNFLKPVDSICVNEKLIISSLMNFNSYLWSTGALTSTISVSVPGQYILTVNDNNGCRGSDTISVIRKNCFREVYLPNAFTPNGDAKNDIFRATVYGNLVQFRLELYNRYGEMIFMSNDPVKGWDGTYRGQPQPLAVYTWRCIYQLEGKMLTDEKGIVTLIR